MNIRIGLSLIIATAFAASAAAQSPSLTELAKAEKARRNKVRATAPEVKTYSDAGKTPAEPAASDESATAAATQTPTDGAPAADPKKKEKTPQELAAEKQQEWAEKVKKAQDEIKSLEDQIAQNERILASTYNITPARADTANRIEADKKKLAAAKLALVALEEERRKAGLPRSR